MKTNIVFLTGGSRDCLGAEPGDRRFMVVEGRAVRTNYADRVTAASLKGLLTASATTAASVVAAHPTPHVGTPGPLTQGGNSTPVLAPVAQVWKSEQVGERGAAK